jgi:hypothetical protein
VWLGRPWLNARAGSVEDSLAGDYHVVERAEDRAIEDCDESALSVFVPAQRPCNISDGQIAARECGRLGEIQSHYNPS